MTWIQQARALFKRDFLIDVRQRLVYVFLVAEAGLALVSYAFLARVFGAARPDGYAPLPFLLVGIALTDSLTTLLVYLSQGVRNLQQSGTLKALLAMPISPTRLMTVSMPYPIARAALDFLLFLGVAVALGLPMAAINVGATIVVFVLAVLAMTSLAVVAAALAVAFKRGDPVRWALGSATWLLSGVLYPTGVLPPLLAKLAWLLPTTHALAAIRATLIDGAGVWSVRRDLAVLAGFALIGIPMALWGFNAAVNYARREGTLGHS
jgi:ABC-type polysaccharide/polyol phosphate export permease